MRRFIIAGCQALYAKDWRQRGLVHGFLDRGLSMREPADITRFEAELATSLLLLEQVHGAEFCSLNGNCSGRPQADAWIAHTSELDRRSIGILTADCAPVLMFVPRIATVAALHCGWRSSVDLLAVKVVEELVRRGADASDIEVLLGPAAGACCYEIGADVAGRVVLASNAGDAVLTPAGNDKFFCDIRDLICSQLNSLGVSPQKIHRDNSCTICNPQYFSHRREKGLSGRQLSFIGPLDV